MAAVDRLSRFCCHAPLPRLSFHPLPVDGRRPLSHFFTVSRTSGRPAERAERKRDLCLHWRTRHKFGSTGRHVRPGHCHRPLPIGVRARALIRALDALLTYMDRIPPFCTGRRGRVVGGVTLYRTTRFSYTLAWSAVVAAARAVLFLLLHAALRSCQLCCAQCQPTYVRSTSTDYSVPLVPPSRIRPSRHAPTSLLFSCTQLKRHRTAQRQQKLGC